MGAAVLLLGLSSSALGDDVALRLNSELQWQWWQSSAVHGEMMGGVASSTAVVMWQAEWGYDVVVVV